MDYKSARPMGRLSNMTKTNKILTSNLGPFFAQNDFSKKKNNNFFFFFFFLEGGGSSYLGRMGLAVILRTFPWAYWSHSPLF